MVLSASMLISGPEVCETFHFLEYIIFYYYYSEVQSRTEIFWWSSIQYNSDWLRGPMRLMTFLNSILLTCKFKWTLLFDKKKRLSLEMSAAYIAP
jgi:hypothetical protein